MTDLSPEAWTSASNEVVNLTISDPSGGRSSFKPIFTYPIYGDSETIFGYQDLKIDLKFDNLTLKPLLDVSFGTKISNVDAEDPEAKLLEFLPQKDTILHDEVKWAKSIEEERASFKIPGQLIHTYKRDDNNATYSIYKTTLADPEAVKLHLRLQIFVLLFIEAGSYIDETDESWDIYLVYENDSSIVGFCTAYNYFLYQGHEQHDASDVSALSYRKKISQFIILPPFQSKGHGGELYNAMFQLWYGDIQIKEICVEDPNESFDDLRDRSDLIQLSKTHQLDFITDLSQLSLPYTNEWFTQKQRALKIEKRQLQRLIEMLLLKLYALKQTSSSKKAIRLQIKKRLYWKNKDSLLELDKPTQYDKLQTAFEGLEQDYERIMEPLDLKLSAKRPIVE